MKSRLRLKGFKGIKAGPQLTWDGLDEIEVDFSHVSGLTAFDGECGSGKSTLLECMHHFPQMVSRDGALWQHVLSRCAEKEFESEFMGHHYRSLIKMDAHAGKQEGYLWIDGKPSVNGKISSYKKMVEDIFGTPFTYFRSQFCPQKSRKTKDMQIENLTAGVFKELLREFLNIQKYAVLEDGSKQAHNIYFTRAGDIDSRISALRESTKNSDLLKEELSSNQALLGNSEEIYRVHTSTISNLRNRVGSLKAAIARNEALNLRKADIEANIVRLNSDLQKEKEVAESELNGLRTKYNEIAAEIENLNLVLKDKDTILNAADREQQINGEIEQKQENFDKLSAEVTNIQNTVSIIETDAAKLSQSIKQLENEEISRLRACLVLNIEKTKKDTSALHEIELSVQGLKSKITACDIDADLIRIEDQISRINLDLSSLKQFEGLR
jgi:DNA repair exonuclease SbcCD ATPase subunit